MENNASDVNRPAWFAGTVAVLVLLALCGWLDRRLTEEAVAELIESYAQSVSVRQCPEKMPGETDVVVMVVRSAAAAEPVVIGCSRIVERSFTAGPGRRK